MQIREIANELGKNVTYLLGCEFCNATQTVETFDESEFYKKRLPRIICTSCGKSTKTIPLPIVDMEDKIKIPKFSKQKTIKEKKDTTPPKNQRIYLLIKTSENGDGPPIAGLFSDRQWAATLKRALFGAGAGFYETKSFLLDEFLYCKKWDGKNDETQEGETDERS